MAHPVDTHVGKRLREQRTKVGMSQEALAQTSGITFQQVQKYERGANRLSASRIYEFAMVLGVSVAYFFEGLEQGGAFSMAEGAADFDHSKPNDQEFMRAFNRIHNQDAKDHVKSLVMALAKGEQSYS